MKKHLRVSLSLFLFLFTFVILIGCGTKRKRSLYFGPDDGSTIGNIIPQLPANGSTLTPPSTSPSPVLSLVANPSTTVVAGQNISLIASFGSQTQFDFRFVGTPPQGVYMATQNFGVSRVEISSMGSARSFEVEVTPSGLTSPSQRIRLEFTEDLNSTSLTYAPCQINGPFAYSGENIPRVGSASIFGVTGPQNQLAHVTRVWTQDPTETASYYYSTSNFYLVFRSAGTKTIHFEAQINPSYSSWQSRNTVCTGQTTVQVSPRETHQNTSSCGTNYVPYNSNPVHCLATGWRSTYYVSNNTCVNYSIPMCSAGGHYRGAFDSLAACEASIQNGSCGSNRPNYDVITQHSATINSRSSDWTDTGISVDSATSLTISVSGQVKYLNSQWAFASPVGVNFSQYQRCKAQGAGSFNNVAVIGKIGANGTPFLVGTHLNRYFDLRGNLYLAVNDMNCRNDNSGSFTATIRKTVHAR